MTAGRIVKELWRTNQEFSPADVIPPWFFVLIYHLGKNNRPVGGRSSDTQSYTIDIIIINMA
jgi:hypothetical protein